MTIRRPEHAITVTTGRDTLYLDGVIRPPDWTEDALCPQVDPNMFFPDKGGSTRPVERICNHCPIQEACLDWALGWEVAMGSMDGIWGGNMYAGGAGAIRPP